MEITGAVLEEMGRRRPYANSRPISVTSLELAPPGPGEALIRVEAAGLCHSDLSVVDGTRPRPLPILLGHEAAGEIVETGPDVPELAAGDRVVMTFLPRCGDCVGCRTDRLRPCVPGSAANSTGALLGGGRRLSRAGQPVNHHLGVSAFATYAVVDAHSLVKLDADIPAPIAAVLGCAVLTGGGAVLNAGRLEPGQTVAIVGLGGVGMAALLTALAYDDVDVVAVDSVDEKRSTALQLGAIGAFAPEETHGLRADLVIEAAGSPRALETAIGLTQAGGTTVTVGLPSPDARVSFSPTALVAEGRKIVGSYLGSAVPRRDIPVFAQMWRAGRLPVEALISSTIGLHQINEGMDELADSRAIRQLIDFTQPAVSRA